MLPPLVEQRAILDEISRQSTGLDAAIDRSHREISLLREYRTRVIADMVTGKLDVREAAARLPDEADESEALQDTNTLTVGDNDIDEGDLDAVPDEAEV